MSFIDKLKKLLTRDGFLVGVLIAVGILIYLNAINAEMFWDDDDFILKNRYIQDWQYWPRFFTENLIAGTHLISNYWRPVLQFVFAIEWHLWADWTPGWHLTSILIHAITSSVLFLALNQILRQRLLAFLTALIFLIHPAQNEAIVYVNSLGDALANLFVFAGLYFYARFRLSGRKTAASADWWLSLCVYPLALMSKETGILLLPFLILSDWMLLDQNLRFRDKAMAALRALWPFIVVAAVYMVLRATVLNFSNSFNFYNQDTEFTTSIGLRVITFFKMLANYAGLLVIPYELRVERLLQPPKSFFELQVLWGGFLFIGSLWLAWVNRNKKPLITFGILWFYVGILPTSNLFVIINALVYEHFLYTALIGVWVVLIWAGIRWAGEVKTRRMAMTAAFTAFAVFFCVRVITRNVDWQTAVGFYEKLIETAPNSYRVVNNLGMEYAEHNQPQKAEETYLKAIAIAPENAVAYHNLGNLYRDRAFAGDRAALDKSISLFEKVIELQPNFIFSYKSLAQLYLIREDYPRARRILEAYYMMSEEKLSTLKSLAQIAFRERNYRASLQYLQLAGRIDPQDPIIASDIEKLKGLIQK